MHITFFTDGIFPYIMGGMQKHATNFIKQWVLQENTITVYHCSLKIDYTKQFSETELNKINFIEITFPKTLKFPGHYIYCSYLYAKALAQHFYTNNKGSNLIFAQGFTGWYIAKKIKEQNSKFRLVTMLHGLEMWQKPASVKEYFKNLLLRFPARICLKNASAIISLGGKTTAIINKVTHNKLPVFEIPIGVDNNFIRDKIIEKNNEISFVFIGRNERRKGLTELNKCILSLNYTYKEKTRFHFIGSIDSGAKLNLSNCIYYGELQNTVEIKSILQKSHYLICPSFSEGMPNVILEAMACSNAIIATDVGAISFLVDNRNGLLIENNSIVSLNNAIDWAMSNDIDTINKMGAFSKNKVINEFTWDKIILKYKNAFEKTFN